MNKPAIDIMSADLVVVSPDQKLVDAKKIFQQKKFHHHIPVVEKGELVGMVSLSDFLYASEGAGIDDNASAYQNKTIRDAMSISPFGLQKSVTIRQVAEELARNEVHAIVILDGKKPIGIISTTDIIRYMLKG